MKENKTMEMIGTDGDLVWPAISKRVLEVSAELLGFSIGELFLVYNKVLITKAEEGRRIVYSLCFDCVENIGRKIEAEILYDQGIYNIIEIKEV